MADRTSSSITINAPKKAIMDVIADYPAYPSWAEGIKKAEVISRHPDGKPEIVAMSLSSGPISDSYQMRLTWLGEDQVSWDLAEPGSMISTMHGSYLLADSSKGGTEVTYELAVDVKIPMLGMFKRKAEKVIIETALKGLKRQVEK